MPRRASGGTLAIGSGSAYANDRLAPAAAMADSGRVSYIGFDCLAERTMALAHVRRRRNPASGQDERIRGLLPLLRGYLAAGGRVVGNFGAANPDAAAADFVEGLRALGLPGVRLGVIRGDDVLDLVLAQDAELPSWNDRRCAGRPHRVGQRLHRRRADRRLPARRCADRARRAAGRPVPVRRPDLPRAAGRSTTGRPSATRRWSATCSSAACTAPAATSRTRPTGSCPTRTGSASRWPRCPRTPRSSPSSTAPAARWTSGP